LHNGWDATTLSPVRKFSERKCSSEANVNRALKIFLALACGITATLAAFSNWPQAQSQQSPQEAEQTFQTRCSTCHAEHGEGSDVGASLNVPDLRSASVQKNDNAFLHQIIKNGKGDMPAFGRDFSDPQIDQIIALVRSFANQKNGTTQASTR
jgi:mono/diheme cytochrome c family protein